MSTPTVALQQALQSAVTHHQAGRLQEAERIYRQILAQCPAHPHTLHLLGLIARQVGKNDAAFDLINQAIASADKVSLHDQASFHLSLGEVLLALGRLDDAAESLHKALAIRPDLVDAHHSLGNVLEAQGLAGPAMAAYRRALAFKPDLAEAHSNLGNLLMAQGHTEEALNSFRSALALDPRLVQAHNNLGYALQAQGRAQEAVASLQRALDLNAHFPQAHNNLGNAYHSLGRLDDAIRSYQRAIALKPDYLLAHNNLGSALREKGRPQEAAESCRRALAMKPDFAPAHYNLGNALAAQGLLDESVLSFQRALALQPSMPEAHASLAASLSAKGLVQEAIDALHRCLELKPDFVVAHSNLLFTLGYSPRHDNRQIYAEARRWNARHALPLSAAAPPHPNTPEPARPLRVGYLSPDFREHPVGRFILPLLEHHDRERFTVSCYAQVTAPDVLTARLQQCAGAWRSIVGCTDQQVADMIRRDGIDILVDLAMHTAGNRLLVLARRPAPVQVAYLAYVGTTGLSAIDYRLTDVHLDPPPPVSSIYSETSIYLTGTYWCYHPAPVAPAVSALPAECAGHVTFGCLNNFCKINDGLLEAWVHILQRVPTARLHLHAPFGESRDRTAALFARHGIDPSRLHFIGRTTLEGYFHLYHDIDIALDTFPYNGGTTTCEALWMGVPVVTVAGQAAMGRAGLSLLANLELSELAGATVDQYVDLAAELAGDTRRLSHLRQSLRERMGTSALMDAPRYARSIEAAYQEMWTKWCRQQRPPPNPA